MAAAVQAAAVQAGAKGKGAETALLTAEEFVPL